ncbi:MAG TPA: type III secretion inner membrane ring lipoprotein SctJ [Luteimonas sp.]|nr:type III secretion inner membrane ring lipoprotein SctJ [Luteimonas sp.]
MKPSNWSARAGTLSLLLACLALAGCGGSALYSNLEEQQANQVMAALLDAGINADKAPSPDKKTWEVRIAESDFPLAMQVLHSKGLPRRQSPTLGELFKKEGFASSALEEKARYIYGLQEAMRQKLLKLDGVVDADVSIALPDRDPLGGETRESSASVFIYQAPGVDLRDRETDLKVGVKDGIEGLDDVNKVTIKFFTVAAPAAAKQASRAPAAMPVLSAISPLAIAITLAVAVLLGLLVAFGSRIRARLAQPRQPPRVWNG